MAQDENSPLLKNGAAVQSATRSYTNGDTSDLNVGRMEDGEQISKPEGKVKLAAVVSILIFLNFRVHISWHRCCLTVHGPCIAKASCPDDGFSRLSQWQLVYS